VLLVSVFSGYSLSRFNFKGKGTVFGVFLLTQMFPVVLLIAPLFVIFSKLQLIDSLYSLVLVYTVFNIPFSSFLMRGFFDNVPKEIEEYAMIDGCSRVASIFRVVLPVMLPGLIATFIFSFISAWNELIFGVVFLNSESVKTLPVGLNFFIQKYDVSWGMMSAGAVVSLIPVFILFGLIPG
ncbi:carbohydrate ABC transporter permease, partial [candidate division KSB1 bacterium]